MTTTFKTRLPLRTDQDSDPTVAHPLAEVRRQMGMVPNMYGAMANHPALLESYQHGYALVRSKAGFSPVEQEVLFLTISRENNCHYCVAAHSFVADVMTKVPAEVTDAIREDEPISDPKLEALRQFARVMVQTRGMPTKNDAAAFLDAGYSEEQILGIILAISVKVLSNYSNHIFHTEVDQAFASRLWEDPQGRAIAA